MKLELEKLLSIFAFNLNLRRYITAPVHQPGTPRVEALNGDYFDLIVKLDEVGSTYYTVDAYSNNTPRAEQVSLGINYM